MICTIERDRTNKFVWTLRLLVKDHFASQRLRILVEAVTIACVAKEVLAEQYRLLNKKDKSKNNNGSSTSSSDSKSTTTQNSQNNQNNNNQNVDSMRKMNENEKTNSICPHCNKRHYRVPKEFEQVFCMWRSRLYQEKLP